MDATVLTHSSPAFSIKVAIFLIIFTKREQKERTEPLLKKKQHYSSFIHTFFNQHLLLSFLFEQKTEKIDQSTKTTLSNTTVKTRKARKSHQRQGSVVIND